MPPTAVISPEDEELLDAVVAAAQEALLGWFEASLQLRALLNVALLRVVGVFAHRVRAVVPLDLVRGDVIGPGRRRPGGAEPSRPE